MPHDNWSASEYADASSLQWRHAMEALRFIEFKPDAAILDIGCGDGKITRWVAEQVPQGQVVGTDLTADMVRFANKRHAGVPNLCFEQMSGEALTFDAAFDHVISFSCFHWMRDQPAVWAGVHRALKPGGKALVGFQANQEHFWTTVEAVVNSAKWRSSFDDFSDPYNHFTLSEMRSYIEGSGLFLKRIEEIHALDEWPSREHLFQFLLSWVPQIRHLQGAERQDFAQEVLDRYLESIDPEMRRRHAMRMRRFIIVAEKALQ
ncbi:class I SAM-dependent methyltransferase [Cerasicoccus frondis]|uniref:class I SAM-dependent methyltransferase n=1 Tax=Cerasicoccus frondis TaxID=490090 RepID=UPI002852B197|nr:methyltransferase domain-containing protein [Cerasicoccus frondis]